MGINLVSPNFAAVPIHLWVPWPTLIELSKWTQAYLRCRPQKNWCCNCITSGSLTWLWNTFPIEIDSLIYGDLPDLNMMIFHTLNSKRVIPASWFKLIKEAELVQLFASAGQSCTWPTWSEQKGRRVDVSPDLFLEVVGQGFKIFQDILYKDYSGSLLTYAMKLCSFLGVPIFVTWLDDWETRSWFMSIGFGCSLGSREQSVGVNTSFDVGPYKSSAKNLWNSDAQKNDDMQSLPVSSSSAGPLPGASSSSKLQACRITRGQWDGS